MIDYKVRVKRGETIQVRKFEFERYDIELEVSVQCESDAELEDLTHRLYVQATELMNTEIRQDGLEPLVKKQNNNKIPTDREFETAENELRKNG